MAKVALATAARLPQLEPDSRVLLPALRERGVEPVVAVWTDPDVDWASFDLVLVRNTWDYADHADDFAAWVDQIGVLWNPHEVVRWNSNKAYLAELGSRGVPVIETLTVAGPVDLPAQLAEHGLDDVVIKPEVGAGGRGLIRVSGADEARAAQTEFDRLVRAGRVLVQPLLPAIMTEGELSLMYIDGSLSHAVVKRSGRPGEIRVQDDWGGTTLAIEPPREAVEVAERALAEVDGELMYARVDLVRAPDGGLRLIELELIEPSMFFEFDPSSAGRFADALVARL